jgi:protoporphyrinogen oxidase
MSFLVRCRPDAGAGRSVSRPAVDRAWRDAHARSSGSALTMRPRVAALEERMRRARIGIIGGGIAGLVAAYDLAKAGVRVTLMESSAKLGGLAASFAIESGCEIEKYYHFICKPDRTYVRMLRELGIHDRLHWATTDMGFFYDGRLYTFGDPKSVLLFPHLSIGDKLRFARATLAAIMRHPSGWHELECMPANEWLVREYGQRIYDILYRPLIEQKFREYAHEVSAAWMCARFYRSGNSRTLAQKERLGYLERGSQLYIDALERALRTMGADTRTNAAVQHVVVEDNRARGVVVNGSRLHFDYVISTVPVPFACRFLKQLDGAYFENLRQLRYIGAMVMLLRLKRRFSKYFWTNVSDGRMDISGIIEYTNLNPCVFLGGDAIVYVPQYLSAEHPLYSMPDDQLFQLYCGYLSMINARFERGWVRQYWVHRDPYSQPICRTSFSNHTPEMRTPVRNLYLTDACQLHPHDRAISHSSDLGRRVANLVLSHVQSGEP